MGHAAGRRRVVDGVAVQVVGVLGNAAEGGAAIGVVGDIAERTVGSVTSDGVAGSGDTGGEGGRRPSILRWLSTPGCSPDVGPGYVGWAALGWMVARVVGEICVRRSQEMLRRGGG